MIGTDNIHELTVRQGLGRRIYRDTAKWPLYLERTYPYRYHAPADLINKAGFGRVVA
jgi:hypothetical protein